MSNNTFFISDTHFGHKNIIEYEDRPFADVEEMNETIIKNWNDIVSKGDIIYHLGDVAFGGSETTRKIVARLNGRKHLIMGNHDRHKSRKWWTEAGFEWVSEYPIILNGFFILSHEPVYINHHMPYLNIHGHIHSTEMKGFSYLNACVEHWDYKPFPMTDVNNYVQNINNYKE